jgi:CubicO group peptidase (beta-lactamase class C family)
MNLSTKNRAFVFMVVILFVGAMALVACLVLTTPAPVVAETPYRDDTKIPDTPACNRALEIIELVNLIDAEKSRAYVLENFTPEFRDELPIEQHLANLASYHARSDGYEVRSARFYEPPDPDTVAVIIAWNRLTESWEAFTVNVEKAPPHRISSLEISPARTPKDIPPQKRLADDEIVRNISVYVDRVGAHDVFSGTVLLAKNGNPIYMKAVGIANRDCMTPMKLDTKLNTGSMYKMFTAVAVAQLAEAGKLSFDDRIEKYIGTDWLTQPILNKVTIEDLLTHTSGLGSYFNETFDRSSRLLFRRLDDFKMLVAGDTLAFEPGSQWQYSNTGFLILGAIIEKVSGEEYNDYIRAHVTGPSGMKNTDCYELDLVNENLAVGYEKEQGLNGTIYRNNIFEHVLRGGPAGGGYTTVEDLLAFDRALRSGKLVSKEMLEKMWRPYPERNSMEYGCGFQIFETPIGRAVGHGGGFSGISTMFMMYLDTGYTWAVLSNYGMGSVPVEEKIQNLIERRE